MLQCHRELCSAGPPSAAIYTAAASASTAAASISTAAASSQAQPPQATFIQQFGIAPELVPGIDVSSLEDCDGTRFDGIVTRDASSGKRLVLWTERTCHLNDRTMTGGTHIRQDQGPDILAFIRSQLVEDRPKLAKGAEGRAQPPSFEDLAGCVRAAKAMADGPAGGASRAASSNAAAAALADVLDIEDPNEDDDGDVHFEEVSTVAGISLAAASASQPGRKQARNPAKRPHSGTGSLSGGARRRRGGDIERLEAGGSAFAGNLSPGAFSASTASPDDVQAEINKLSIWDILSNGKHGITRMSIYNAARHSAMRSAVARQPYLGRLCWRQFTLCTTSCSTRQRCATKDR